MQKVFIERLASFVPTEARPKPDVSFVPMLTRRRLSYISRMVVLVSDQVSRDNEGNKLTPCKVTFASQFGEISQQLKISQTLLDTGMVSPAHFSLSVFNASTANASILETNAIPPYSLGRTPLPQASRIALPPSKVKAQTRVHSFSQTSSSPRLTLPLQESLTRTPFAP